MDLQSMVVEYFKKQLELGQEVDKQILPAVTLDPSGEFAPEERGGKFLWQYPELYPAFGAKMWKKMYVDENILITPCFSRFQGNIELLFWFSSVYEYLDFRTKLFMFSGGYGRWLRPKLFWSYITLPDEIIDFFNLLQSGEFSDPDLLRVRRRDHHESVIRQYP